MNMEDETGSRGALKSLKMCVENPSQGPSLVDAIRDAAQIDNEYNRDFLNTIAAFAIEGWRNA